MTDNEGVKITNREIYDLVIGLKESVAAVKHDTSNLRLSQKGVEVKVEVATKRIDKLEKWQTGLAAIGALAVVVSPIVARMVWT